MNDSSATWWGSVSTQELRASHGLVKDVVHADPLDEPAHVEALARALAIQTLLVDEATFGRLVSEATNVTIAADEGGRPQACEAVSAWLDRCAKLEEVFSRTLELLGKQAGGAEHAQFHAFIMHLAIRRQANTSEAFSRGTRRGMAPMRYRLRGKGV